MHTATGDTSAIQADYTTIRVENHGPVRAIILDRPDHRNSLDLVIRTELGSALRNADADRTVRAILLAGAGKVFCAGGDIKSLSPDAEASRSRLSLMGEVTRSILESETPVLAAVQGGAWGAGLALVCACDVVVAAESARFVASFGRFGLVGDSGIYHTLRQRVTPARAREILLLNSSLSARQALQDGIATCVVPDDKVWDESLALARQLSSVAPGANAWTKRLIAQADQDFESVISAEIDAQVELLAAPAFDEGQRAFVEKREARWWDDDEPESGGG